MNDRGILLFPPDEGCPSTDVSKNDDDGPIASGLPVHLLFWGHDWTTPAGALLADSLVEAVQAILAGPWMSGLRQYGIKRCSFGSTSFIPHDPPLLPNTFETGDVEDMVQDRIDSGQFPEPDEPGGQNLYVVFLPPNTEPWKPRGGAHSFFTSGTIVDRDRVWFAYICTGSKDDMVRRFSHELAEVCADPEDDGWYVDGASQRWKEIGDLCSTRTGPVSGVNNVEAYWSNQEGRCIIPTTWSVRRQLIWAGHKLNGNGLLSLQDPIPSMKQFIVNL